jgi:hypothetical protein
MTANRPDPGLPSKALFGAGLVAVGIGQFVANRDPNRDARNDHALNAGREAENGE